MAFERPILQTIVNRLTEPQQKIQIISGARQVGKTTLIQQALKKIGFPSIYAIAESGYTSSWIDQQWARARAILHEKDSLHRAPVGEIILVIDEIQKIPNWSERIKRLWDEESNQQQSLRVVLLGSSSLLLHRGLTESLAGRYKVIPISHWSFSECQKAFGLTLNEFIYFGGYPGSLNLRHDEDRFLAYIQDSIIEPVVAQDILSQHVVQKPALLRQLFRLGCEYSGQILSFNKMLGQMQDAGNSTTLAHYLTLLDQAGVLKGFDKFSREKVRQRQSSPKLQVYNNALRTAVMKIGFKEAIENPELKGRLVESAVGAHLLMDTKADVYYWRLNNQEVDFIVQSKGKTIAIEVKSGKKATSLSGLETFSKKFHPDAKLLVGADGIPLEVFLSSPFHHWVPL